jgi:hypothetical protein
MLMGITGSDPDKQNPDIAALCVRRNLPIKSTYSITECLCSRTFMGAK